MFQCDLRYFFCIFQRGHTVFHRDFQHFSAGNPVDLYRQYTVRQRQNRRFELQECTQHLLIMEDGIILVVAEAAAVADTVGAADEIGLPAGQLEREAAVLFDVSKRGV